jgi:Fe-S-cluster containining protein
VNVDDHPSVQAPAELDVLRGLLYAHSRANANTSELCNASAAVEALSDLLVEAGALDGDELERRRQSTASRLKGEYLARGMAVAMQEFDVSKYEFESEVEIDCENRIPLCGAACCKLPLALSGEDMREGIVRWDLGQPYMIAHGDDGYCVHMDRCTHHCGIYQQRPIPCRGYDCRADRRIWLDFERRIVNPKIHDPDWPASAEEDGEDPGRSELEPQAETCSTISTAH